jgi:hypothetical protein
MTVISAIQVANVIHTFFRQTAADFAAFPFFTIFSGWAAALDKNKTTQEMQSLFLSLSSGTFIVAPPEIATLAGAKVYDGFDKNFFGATAAVLAAEVRVSDKVGPALVSLPKVPGMIKDALSRRQTSAAGDDAPQHSGDIELKNMEEGVRPSIRRSRLLQASFLVRNSTASSRSLPRAPATCRIGRRRKLPRRRLSTRPYPMRRRIFRRRSCSLSRTPSRPPNNSVRKAPRPRPAY